MENQSKESLKKYLKGNSKEESFFCVGGVYSSFQDKLKQRFEVLLLQAGLKQQELADKLGVSKTFVSLMVHGKQIPILDMRLKTARILNTDSALIWEQEDLPIIKKIIKRQKRMASGEKEK